MTEELERLMCLLAAKIPWQREIAERAETLKARLLDDSAEAHRQLKIWQEESAKNLGFGKVRRIAAGDDAISRYTDWEALRVLGTASIGKGI